MGDLHSKRRLSAGTEDLERSLCKRPRPTQRTTTTSTTRQRTSTEPRLQYFPHEILLNIVSHVSESQDSIKTYPNLCLVSSSFYRVTAEYLWKNYKHRWASKNVSKTITIIERFDLARHVKSINSEYHGNEDPTFSTFGHPRGRKPLVEHIKAMDIPSLQKLLDSRYRWASIPDLELTALISHTPNLESLSINVPSMEAFEQQTPQCFEPLLYAARGLKFGTVRSFAKLSHLRINMLGLELRSISALFALPSLLTVDLENFSSEDRGDTAPDDWEWDCAAQSSNVTTLRFWHCKLPNSVLDSAIRSCKALDLFGVWNSNGFSYEGLSVSLGVHRTLLEKVQLDGPLETRYKDRTVRVYKDKFGPLEEFTALKSVKAPVRVLGGLRILEEACK